MKNFDSTTSNGESMDIFIVLADKCQQSELDYTSTREHKKRHPHAKVEQTTSEAGMFQN